MGPEATDKTRAIDLQTLQEHPFPQYNNPRENFTRDWKYSYYGRVDKGSTAGDKPVEPDTVRIFRKDALSGMELALYRATDMSVIGRVVPSPDGRSVAFLGKKSAKDATLSLWVLNLSGGERREMPAVELQEFSWTPDSRAIIFIHLREIWVQPADGSKPYDMGVHLKDSPLISAPSISPDGSRVAFDAFSEIRNVWTIKNLFPEKSVAKK